MGITCDNASANDKMIDEIDVRMEKFMGSLSHVRCFGHVIQLVGKGLLRQFEPPKKGKKTSAGDDDEHGLGVRTSATDEDEELLVLLEEDEEETEAQRESEAKEGKDDEVVDEGDEDEDEEDGLEDKKDGVDLDNIVETTEEECAVFKKMFQPVRLALTKVSGTHRLQE